MNKYTNEQGRSMIEMLGVLAVVGVLTVAGIMGFSSAMERHKLNQLRDQLQQISSNMIRIFSDVRNYSDLGKDSTSATDTAIRLGIFPENMIQADGSIRHALGGEVIVHATDYADLQDSAFTIVFEGLPKKMAVNLATDSNNISNNNLMYLNFNANDEGE